MNQDGHHLTKHVTWEIAPADAGYADQHGYWSCGDVIGWHYRRSGSCREGLPVVRQYVLPVRVVRDDERGLVAWLAPGTAGIGPVHAEGRRILRGRRVQFDYPWRMATRKWIGAGSLRIAPTGKPWSIWLAWRNWEFVDWYINLEDVHLRNSEGVYTSDHVLDLIVKPTGQCIRKDADELQAALEQGHFCQDQVAAIQDNALAAEAYIQERPWPFDQVWQDWRPNPEWTVPVLSTALRQSVETPTL